MDFPRKNGGGGKMKSQQMTCSTIPTAYSMFLPIGQNTLQTSVKNSLEFHFPKMNSSSGCLPRLVENWESCMSTTKESKSTQSALKKEAGTPQMVCIRKLCSGWEIAPCAIPEKQEIGTGLALSTTIILPYRESHFKPMIIWSMGNLRSHGSWKDNA